MEKKGVGLPMYVIAIIIVGLIALVIFILYAMGVIGHGKGLSQVYINMTENASENATSQVGRLQT